MPRTKVVLYRETDGSIPLLDWLDQLPARAKAKCELRLERLRELGHQLRRPEADYLRDGMYELRVGWGSMNYRMLYFFHGTVAAVVTQGLTKKQAVPPREIEIALRRKATFAANPAAHMHEE